MIGLRTRQAGQPESALVLASSPLAPEIQSPLLRGLKPAYLLVPLPVPPRYVSIVQYTMRQYSTCWPRGTRVEAGGAPGVEGGIAPFQISIRKKRVMCCTCTVHTTHDLCLSARPKLGAGHSDHFPKQQKKKKTHRWLITNKCTVLVQYKYTIRRRETPCLVLPRTTCCTVPLGFCVLYGVFLSMHVGLPPRAKMSHPPPPTYYPLGKKQKEHRETSPEDDDNLRTLEAPGRH